MSEDTHSRISRLETDVAALRGEVRGSSDRFASEMIDMRNEMRGVRDELRTIGHQVEPILGVVKQARIMLPLLAFLIVGAQMFLGRPSGNPADEASRNAERAALVKEIVNILKESSK